MSAAAALAVLLVSLGVASSSVPASATPVPPVADDPTPALVELTGLDPLDAANSDTEIVTFEGSITNRSDEPLSRLNAVLRLSRIPLTDRADLAQLTDPDFRPGARQSAFVPAADLLAPGASTPFSLDVPVADLGLVEPGVYATGIEVLATGADGSRGVVGWAMTALPWMPADAAVAPVGVALAWPVTAPVDRASDGTYLSDGLAEAIAPGGAGRAVSRPSATLRSPGWSTRQWSRRRSTCGRLRGTGRPARPGVGPHRHRRRTTRRTGSSRCGDWPTPAG